MQMKIGVTLGLTAVCAAAIACAGSARASDLRAYKAAPKAAAVVYDWTGFYIGAHVGVARSHHDYWSRYENDPEDFGSAGTTDVLGGLQAGANWQAGNLVLGVEGDISFADIGATLTSRPFVPDYESRNRWLGTATARAGYAFNNVLVYAKGGAAFADMSMTAIVEGLPLQGTTVVTGWAAGGGVEYGFAPDWSFKLEYLYVDLPEKSFVSLFPPGGGNVTYKLSENISTLKFGLNYRFGVSRY